VYAYTRERARGGGRRAVGLATGFLHLQTLCEPVLHMPMKRAERERVHMLREKAEKDKEPPHHGQHGARGGF
jgi:hypothetical protein